MVLVWVMVVIAALAAAVASLAYAVYRLARVVHRQASRLETLTRLVEGQAEDRERGPKARR